MERKILIVEDDPAINELMQMIFDDAGFLTHCLDKGKDVVETVHDYRPDVILMDVLLGDSDGRDLCRILKSESSTKNIPLFIVSATHDEITRHEKNCGADGYVKKPFDIDHLVMTAHNACIKINNTLYI